MVLHHVLGAGLLSPPGKVRQVAGGGESQTPPVPPVPPHKPPHPLRSHLGPTPAPPTPAPTPAPAPAPGYQSAASSQQQPVVLAAARGSGGGSGNNQQDMDWTALDNLVEAYVQQVHDICEEREADDIREENTRIAVAAREEEEK